MPKGPIRRAQLIAPFGTGAMVVVRDGTSLIACGLDHWYKRDNDETVEIYDDEYRVEEWRLQRQLQVSHFRQPPDYRDKKQAGERVPNFKLTVPFLRFPQWHFCPSPGCRRLYQQPLSARSKAECIDCKNKNRKRYLIQVPFVAMCDNGHLQDFPWHDWVHRSADSSCKLPLRLIATGGASLASQKVVCDCGKERSLASITQARPDGTTLSDELDETGEKYLCRGNMPWLGTGASEICDRPIRGSLRSASNVYYAQIKSAIYLPRGNSAVPSELIQMLQEPPLSTPISMLIDAGAEVKPSNLRSKYSQQLEPYTDEQIEEALRIALNGEEETGETAVAGDDIETAFRRAEYQVLKTVRNEEELQIKAAELSEYAPNIAQNFSKIMLVNKLRETRAFAGFTRIVPENDQDLERRKAMLWKNQPGSNDSWLPAYIVYGEGIFLEFNEERLQQWESRPEVISRVDKLVKRYNQNQLARGGRIKTIFSRLLLLHTFSHLLMNRLTFECGYSSAALRERLFVSQNPIEPMAGILIYTAAGDAEGTMGGLVRMGKPGYLEPVIRRALEGAQWCSSDPVCMEMGAQGGQGPDSCNLAACHSCGLVPETACENFNRFLDRAVVIGDANSNCPGYFAL